MGIYRIPNYFQAVVKGFKNGKAILDFPEGEWHDVKDEMRKIKAGEIRFEKNELKLIEESGEEDNRETKEEEEDKAIEEEIDEDTEGKEEDVTVATYPRWKTKSVILFIMLRTIFLLMMLITL